jgi:hypothetical protein
MKFNLIKNKYELNKHFEIRKKIIDFYDPKNNQDFIYINNLSHIYINMKFLNCTYNSKTEKIVNNLLEKLNKKINKNSNKNINIKNSKNIKLKTDINFNTLKVAELKNLLKKKKLSVSGKKSELIQRLKTNSH